MHHNGQMKMHRRVLHHHKCADKAAAVLGKEEEQYREASDLHQRCSYDDESYDDGSYDGSDDGEGYNDDDESGSSDEEGSATGGSGSSSGSSYGSDTGAGAPDGNILTGQGTYYNMAGGTTACGGQYSDSDMVAALAGSLFDSKTPNGNPNNNALCGKRLRATYKGKSITVKAVDRCEGCSYSDLDFTPAAFSQLANMDVGRISGVEWHWL